MQDPKILYIIMPLIFRIFITNDRACYLFLLIAWENAYIKVNHIILTVCKVKVGKYNMKNYNRLTWRRYQNKNKFPSPVEHSITELVIYQNKAFEAQTYHTKLYIHCPERKYTTH